ncbi:MAG: GNAT family N-acetyltransferase [Clostridium sp.]
MIFIEKLKEKDADLLERWKCNYKFANDIRSLIVNRTDIKLWMDRINSSDDCQYWIINNGGIKIGVIDINHIDKDGCTLEYYIGDIHFRDRKLEETILCNMYDYIFNELNLNFIVINIYENDKSNFDMYSNMGCEVNGRFDYEKHTNKNIGDLLCLLIKKEKWNNIKSRFNYDKILIEKYIQKENL